MKQDKGKKPYEKRPYIASECKYLPDAERWRQDVIKEIIRDVTQIQNESLGEYRIRELNDNINKRLREKTHWERRIAELGGRRYHEMSQKVIDDEGLEAPGSRGYKYFGAAKKLPGVKDLFFQKPSETAKRNRYELYSSVDADYYGFRDEDDGVLLKVEAAATLELERQAKRRCLQKERENQDKEEQEEGGEGEEAAYSSEEEEEAEFVAHVVLPSTEELEESLLQRKKEELLKKYLEDVEEDEDE
uniref:Pre-mRNA-splicing factor ISY1 homolog n=1 Tax=Paramoeba aestuarina TaxID=180227 RepID=A0A7S4KSW5_9EUKA